MGVGYGEINVSTFNQDLTLRQDVELFFFLSCSNFNCKLSFRAPRINDKIAV